MTIRNNNNKKAVQGLVNLLPVTPSIGGNAILVGSNKVYPDHYLQNDFYQIWFVEIHGDDWLEIPNTDDGIFHGRQIVSCQLQPGDILLWDSRAVHCSYPGERSNGGAVPKRLYDNDVSAYNDSDQLVWAATLVSKMPRDRATNEVIRRRLKAVKNSWTLTHWANQAAPLGEEHADEAAKESACIATMKELPGLPVRTDVNFRLEQCRKVFGCG